MEHIVHIEKIIAGGSGLARLDDGMIAFVPLTLPGETVRIKEIRRKRSFLQGTLLEILQRSPHRRQAPCPLYTICGGCNLQHVAYDTQLAIKTAIVQEAMQRAHVPVSDDVLQQPVAAPYEFSYRYRIRLQIDRQGQAGFMQRASNTITPVRNCPIAAKSINRALADLHSAREYLQSLPDCRELELHCSPCDDSVFCVLLFADAGSLPVFPIPPDFINIHSLATMAGRKYTNITGPRNPTLHQHFTSPPFSLSWQPGCFSQVNPEQNERLIKLVLGTVGDVRGLRVLDLYCGMGNFSVPLGLAGASGIGIEYNQLSVARAAQNSRAAELQTWHFIQGKVGAELEQLAREGEAFDIVVLDPPRSGVGREIDKLIALQAKRICYISCDPATLARDCQKLLQADYRLTSLTPLDMFPQTHHIETVALLEK